MRQELNHLLVHVGTVNGRGCHFCLGESRDSPDLLFECCLCTHWDLRYDIVLANRPPACNPAILAEDLQETALPLGCDQVMGGVGSEGCF